MYIKKESMVETFLIHYMKNRTNGDKKLQISQVSEHAHLLGSSEYILTYLNDIINVKFPGPLVFKTCFSLSHYIGHHLPFDKLLSDAISI